MGCYPAILRRETHPHRERGAKGVTLIPVEFKQVSPDSGFDWVQRPHWLMVPQSGTNQAIALTPASSSFQISFNVNPSGSDPTVSPTSTTSTSQTITVSGNTLGTTSTVVIGVGPQTTGTESGLHIDVKPKTTGTIAIHAVTQHYTQPMAPPSPSGGFTPGTVCVTATGSVMWTQATPPDQDQGNTIITGPDGICHTQANLNDKQVIPVGQGIPKDIVPQDAPSASDFQTYLNQVFGKQANQFFTVTRNDFSVDYDVKKDGELDITQAQNSQSTGQKIIDGHATPGVTFNIYFVADYQGLPLSGTTPDHSSIGMAYYPIQTAYVRDNFVVLNATAHEVGHLLDLGHTNAPLLPSLDWNPATTDKIPDPSPSDRLMYPTCSGSNTLLIQPEWDIVNPNQKKQ